MEMTLRKPLIQRISLDEETGCWNWRGAHYKKGYGVTHYKGRNVSAHRLSAHLWLGMDLSDPRQVMHNCDNPRCFNPKHLKIGTQLENEMDKIARGRHHYAKRTECKHGHPLTPDNVKIGEGNSRVCLTCVKTRNDEMKNRNYFRGLNSKGNPWARGPYKSSKLPNQLTFIPTVKEAKKP
jgi:hypothetical protein